MAAIASFTHTLVFSVGDDETFNEVTNEWAQEHIVMVVSDENKYVPVGADPSLVKFKRVVELYLTPYNAH